MQAVFETNVHGAKALVREYATSDFTRISKFDSFLNAPGFGNAGRVIEHTSESQFPKC